MVRVLVTGATGFIGRQATASLLERGHEVHGLSRVRRSSPGISWHAADIGDISSVRSVLRKVRPSHMLHLAWETSHGSYYTSPANEVWLRHSLTLADAFLDAGGNRIIGAGTSAEYDLTTGAPMREDATPISPNGLYGRCKVALHDALRERTSRAGAQMAWVRVFFVYGPGEAPNRTIPSVVRALEAGKQVPFQPATTVRDYLHVRDVGVAFAHLVAHPFNGAVNVGSGEGIQLRTLLEAFALEVGRPGGIDFGALPAPPYEPAFVVADTKRIREAVGWKPQVNLEEGIRDTMRWWRQ